MRFEFVGHPAPRRSRTPHPAPRTPHPAGPLGWAEMPPLLVESSDDSDLAATGSTAPSVTVAANRKAPRTKKVTTNFARLMHHQVVFADESGQQLKQRDNNTNLAT